MSTAMNTECETAVKAPRVMLCAGASNSGKTLITCGILQALKNRGMKLASFKCGPDYIDPMFHERVIGTRARNLDSFFAKPEVLRFLLAENSREADVSVVEGVMGYYDGIAGTHTEASSYDVARITDTPAVLIVNCKGMSLSCAAYIQGFASFRSDSNIKGVILNRVSPMIYGRLKEEIEKSCGIPVIGYVPQADDCVIESRHLGLVMPDEIEGLKQKLMKLAELLEETLDIDMLLGIAAAAPEIKLSEAAEPKLHSSARAENIKLALARDAAFCFIYEDNLKLLRKLGAEIVEFSPLTDNKLPEGTAGLLLCGGYPELYAKQLAANVSMKEDIRRRHAEGLPILAECGGFMYLHDEFEDMDGSSCEGVGLIGGRAFKTEKLSRFGYIKLTARNNKFFDGSDAAKREGNSSAVFPAHEFHYFESTDAGEDFDAVKPASNRGWKCIHSSKTMLAGFPHFYYYGNPLLAECFIEKCRDYAAKKD